MMNWRFWERWRRLEHVNPEPPSREAEILTVYSPPSLRTNVLTRAAKKDHLAVGYGTIGEAADKILDQLYPDGEVLAAARPAPKEPPMHVLGADHDKAKMRRAGTSS